MHFQGQEKRQKNDNFSHFAKHKLIKTTVLLQPPFSPKIVVFQLGFFETKNIDIEEKHNLKSENSKDKKKGFETKNKTGTKNEKILMEKNVAIEHFDVVPFMKQKQSRKKWKKETKTRNQKKAKKKDKKEGKRTRTRERETEKEKLKKGEAKKG